MLRNSARTMSILVICLGIVGLLSNPIMADFKSFGVYQDTDPNGRLDPGDTFLGGVMNWWTYDSAASSYNYGDHYVPGPDPSPTNPYPDPLAGFTDLTGAPWASDSASDTSLGWLPISNESEDDVLHLYMVWSWWDNNSDEGEQYERGGFSLGIIANSFIRSRSVNSPSGGYHLDIAIRNDDSSVPQVTMSDDYDSNGGRPPAPGYKDNDSQELYKTAVDLDPGALYNHYFEGVWEYTASTADGGIIGGIHNGDYDVLIDPSKIVTSVSGDGLVIRIDPESLRNEFGDITKIVFYDFGYKNNEVYHESNPWELEIPLGTTSDKTFFIASIPEEVPEPSALLSLLLLGGMIVLGKGRR